MSFTQVPPNSTGNKIDTIALTEGADTVHRQVVVIGDDGAGGDIITQLNNIADTLLFVAGAMLEKLPRVTGNDQMAVSIEGGTVGTINQVGGRWATGDNLNLAGVQHIYNNIVVT